MLAAKGGEADEAEMIVLEMEELGLAPGPRAYHALVYAYVKAGDPDGALDAIRRTHAAGLIPSRCTCSGRHCDFWSGGPFRAGKSMLLYYWVEAQQCGLGDREKT